MNERTKLLEAVATLRLDGVPILLNPVQDDASSRSSHQG